MPVSNAPAKAPARAAGASWKSARRRVSRKGQSRQIRRRGAYACVKERVAVSIDKLPVSPPFHQAVRGGIQPDQHEIVRIGLEHGTRARLVEIKFQVVANDLERIDGVVPAVD